MKPLRVRDLVLALALAVSVAAAVWVSQVGEEVGPDLAKPLPAKRRPAGAVPVLQDSALLPAQRQPWAPVGEAELAAWSPPPPPPAPPPQAAVPAPAPPPPMAPPFAYQLIGQLGEGAQLTAFLAGPARSLAVKAGEVVDGQWRIDQITPGGIRITWLPAGLSQTLAFRPLP